MDGALYRRALRCAERLFSEMSAKHVIDGRDAHDFAIDSIMRNPSTWTCDRVKFDIIDAIRRENGMRRMPTGKRVGFRRIVGDNYLKVVRREDDAIDEPDEIGRLVVFEPRNRFVLACLARGVPKRRIAMMLGVSQTRVSQIVNELRVVLAAHWKIDVTQEPQRPGRGRGRRRGGA